MNADMREQPSANLVNRLPSGSQTSAHMLRNFIMEKSRLPRPSRFWTKKMALGLPRRTEHATTRSSGSKKTKAGIVIARSSARFSAPLRRPEARRRPPSSSAEAAANTDRTDDVESRQATA